MPAYAPTDKHLSPLVVESEKTVDSVSVEQASRLPALDAARLLATFSIVWVHVWESHGGTPPLAALGRFGTSFYILSAALFVVRSALKEKRRSAGAEIKQRALRLLKPFVAWSLVYALYYGTYGYLHDYTWRGLIQWWGPLAGTAVHLWFLPFVFFWGTLAALVTPALLRVRRTALLIGGLVLTAALYRFCYNWLHFSLDRHWLWDYHLHRLDRWIYEVPPFVAATLGAIYFHKLPERVRSSLRKAVVPIAATCVVGFFATELLYLQGADFLKKWTDTEGRFMANLAALFLLCGFLAMNRTRFVEKLAPLGRYTYLAFLSHMLVLELIRDPVKSIPDYGSPWIALACSVFVFAGSLAIAWLVQHMRLLRPLRP